ncbi:unnamed protein product [Durusdinium trenchii]|uniref:Peptidase A1 domain-containing protein n=1 Tax=Durusdinium trenchii TaxID=1381693 RepID=A0ABP0MUJ3_9DINO
MTVRSSFPWQGCCVSLILVALIGNIEAGRESPAEELFHSGYEAVHVTRLHRYEHEGMASFLEAEARWSAHEEIGSTLLSRARPRQKLERRPQGFVRVSKLQEAALKAHQAAFLEVTFNSSVSATAGRFRSSDALLRYHSLTVPDETHPAETRLTSLESQYIGQIGVGPWPQSVLGHVGKTAGSSVLSPRGCQPSESLIYLGPADYQAASEEQKKACHVKDESLVWVVFDTGSTNIWVSSVLCQEGPCASSSRNRYNRSNSRTYSPAAKSGLLQIEFGTGRITGPEAVDDFHIGPFSVYNQTFGMIQTEEGRVFEEIPVEGILGLAFPAMAANGIRPFVDGIIQNKAIGRNEFAFYFSHAFQPRGGPCPEFGTFQPEGAGRWMSGRQGRRILECRGPDDVAGNAIFWGGVDRAFYSGDIEYFPVVEPYYWAVQLKDFKIGQDSLLHLLLPEEEQTGLEHLSHRSQKQARGEQTTFKAIVDTGTTFFTAQGRLFKEVMNRLTAAPCSSLTEQSHPDITYTLVNTAGEARDFVLTNKQYMLHGGEGEDVECTPAFMMIQVPAAHGPGMVLGEVFLRIYFAVFDRGSGAVQEARLGLAPAMHDTSAKSRLKGLTAHQPVYHRPTTS